MMSDIERMELDLIRFRHARQLLWFILQSNGGYTLEYADMQDYPGDDIALIERTDDPITKAVTFTAQRS